MAEEDFFDFDGEEDEKAEGEDAEPVIERERHGLEEGLHRRSIGEEGLHDEESDDGKKNRPAPEDAAPIPRRCRDVTAVAEVEQLADHEGIDRHGAGVLDNDTGVDPLIEKRGADRGGEKDVDQDVVELEEKTFEQAVTGRRGKLVGAVPGK